MFDYLDWGYLLCEYYELYWFLLLGGSDLICVYQWVVCEVISWVLKFNVEICFDVLVYKLVMVYLKWVFDEGWLECIVMLICVIELV